MNQIALYVYLASAVFCTLYFARVGMFPLMVEFMMVQAEKKGVGTQVVMAKIGKQILIATTLCAILFPVWNTLAAIGAIGDLLGISEFGKWKKSRVA